MGVNIYIIDVNTSEAVHIQLVLRSFILLCIYLFSLPYNVEVVVPNWPISRGNCWAAHTIQHQHRIFNVPEIRVWVRTDDLHCETLLPVCLTLPLKSSTTTHDEST